MCQCIQFSQPIGDTQKKLKLFKNKELKKVYTIKVCSMYKLYNKTIGIYKTQSLKITKVTAATVAV